MMGKSLIEKAHWTSWWHTELGVFGGVTIEWESTVRSITVAGVAWKAPKSPKLDGLKHKMPEFVGLDERWDKGLF